MLLTPYCELSVSNYLCCQDTFDTFVEGLFHLLTHRLTYETLIRLFLLHDIAEHTQGVHHSIIVVGDVYLIVAHLWPELWPASVLILSAEQILYAATESIEISIVFCLLVQTGKICDLHICGSIVGSGVISPLLVSQYLGFLLV